MVSPLSSITKTTDRPQITSALVQQRKQFKLLLSSVPQDGRFYACRALVTQKQPQIYHRQLWLHRWKHKSTLDSFGYIEATTNPHSSLLVTQKKAQIQPRQLWLHRSNHKSTLSSFGYSEVTTNPPSPVLVTQNQPQIHPWKYTFVGSFPTHNQLFTSL